MFEALVKRLLETYLAPYVDGITQNLYLAVWSGNVILENLTVKRNISTFLAFPLTVLSGRIGKINLKIPWASLGTNPVKINVENVYICFKGRTDTRSDAELLDHIRMVKSKMIAALEREFTEFATNLKAADLNSSYFIRLSQKVLNNIEVDFNSIHLHFCGHKHSFGFVIDSISVRKSANDESLNYLKVETDQGLREEPITHICSLLGFSIYESDDPKLVYKDEEAAQDGAFLLDLVGNTDVRAPLSQREAESLSKNTILRSLSLRFYLAINPKSKAIFASLRIGSSEAANEELLRVVFSIDSIRAFMILWNDLRFENQRGDTLLMQHAHTVALDSESMKGATKAEYIGLYSKLQANLLHGKDPLSPEEVERLQILTDVVPARHLARWRFACRKLKSPSKDVQASGTWFGWVRGIVSNRSATGVAVKLPPAETLPGGLVLTDEELNMIKEAMTLDEMFEDTVATSAYYIECMLPKFQFVTCVGNGKTDMGDAVSVEIDYLQSRIYMHAVVDSNDKDTYQGFFHTNLDSIIVRFHDVTIMQFISDTHISARSDVSSSASDNNFAGNCGMNLRMVHKVTQKGNLLAVSGELKPLETHVIPAIISDILELALYIQPPAKRVFELPKPATLKYSTTNAPLTPAYEKYATAEVVEEINDDDSFLDDDLPEKPVYAAAVEHLPSLFAFDLRFAAPILRLYSYNGDQMHIFFGTLQVKSNGACQLTNVSGTIMLKETKVACFDNAKTIWFDILKPLPVKIHYTCDFIGYKSNFDMLFEEVFVTTTPKVVDILTCIPSEITKILTEAQSAFKRPVVNQLAVQETSDAKLSKEYTLATSVVIRHSGFAVSDGNGVEVFKLELCNAALGFDATASKTLMSLGVEQIVMSNPCVKLPLFITNFGNLPTARSERDDEFEDAMEETLKSLDIQIIAGNSTLIIDANVVNMEVNWQYTSIKLILQTVEEYKQVFKRGLSTRESGESILATATIQTIKQKFGMADAQPKQSATGIGIASVNFGESIPLLLSETIGASATRVFTIRVRGAAVALCNSQNEPMARLSLTDMVYKNAAYKNMEHSTMASIGTGQVLFEGRCIMTHSITPGECGHLLSIHVKSYDSANLHVPYSMCVKGNLERLVAVYFHQDVRKILDYLDDGIIDVFISKSYHKVVETAAATYMLYTFSISSPCFLIPENKSMFRDKFPSTPPGPRDVTRINSFDVKRLVESGKVDVWYFGSYLLFELGHLHLRNGYTLHKDTSTPKSTLFLKMLGTTASVVEQPGGSVNVSGSILDRTDVAVCYSSADMMEVGIDSRAWVLRLSRMQMTFVIDVFNENMCGSSYDVAHLSTPAASSKQESRHNLRLSLSRFEFDISFCDKRPLAKMLFNDITVCLDYASNNVAMTSCYQFGLCGKSLTVDDERKSSNAYKRFLNCCADSAETTITLNDKALEPSVDGLLQNWLRRFKREYGHDFYSTESKNTIYGVKCIVVNENLATSIDAQVANSVIPLLCVFGLDVVNYFNTAYNCSTMSTCPKNIQQTQQASKTYAINFKVSNGKFIAFTQMDKLHFPQLELCSDFVLAMTMCSKNWNILNAEILGCQLARVYPLEKRRQVLSSNLSLSATGQYVGESATTKTFLNFVLPTCELTLYTKDLRILLSAFGALMTDEPSAATTRSTSLAPPEPGTPGKITSITLNIHGVTTTFYDDLRKSLIPMMRCRIAGEKLEYLNLQIEKRYNIIKCSFRLYYFNAAIGDWEPCLERCNATMEYTINQLNEKHLRKSNRLADDVWKDFVPQKVFKLTSLHNILINITPSFCQLILWFIPMLADNIQKGLVYDEPTTAEKVTSIEACAYRYINLTGYEYLGFTLDTSCANQVDAYGDVKVIATTNEVLELDTLVSREEAKEPCIYLVPRPPEAHVRTLCEEFGITNEAAVLRDLMVTRSMSATRQNLRHCNPGSIPVSYQTPFENGTSAFVIPLVRNSCVQLTAPILDVPCSTSHVSPDPLGHQEPVLCEIKSPHPSHKLLIFTSTVRIYNRSGVPLLLCFLTMNLKPVYVSNLKTRCAPISLLEQVAANEEFVQTTGLVSNATGEAHWRDQPEVGYTLLLEPNSFASVPEWAFVGNAQVILSFIPAQLVTENTMEMLMKPDDGMKWTKLVNTSGWSKMIDSAKHLGTRVRQCYRESNSDSQFMYFVVSVVKKKSLFPANTEMRDVVIYPSLSIMNTLPVDLTIKVAAKGYNVTAATATIKPEQGPIVQQVVTVTRRSIMHIFSVPPNETLTLVAKLANLDAAYWSEKISRIYGTTETHTTFELPIKGAASLEVELIRCPGGLPISANTFQGHLSLIVNAPWWFIDRSGLKLSPFRRYHRRSFNGLSFLSTDDENQPVQLAINGKVPDITTSPPIRLPAVGGYSYAFVEDGSRKHAVCLTTEKVYISGVSSLVSCRITYTIPEYILTNNLEQDIYIRKDSRVQPIEVASNASIAIPWTSFRQMGTETATSASFEFKPTNDSHWSSCIVPSEQYSGTNYMCILQERSNKPKTFKIVLVPKKGTKYCSISLPSSNNEGYILVNSCSCIKAAMVRTFHQTDNVEGSLKGTYFTAKYGQCVHFGWAQPFLHKSKLCQVLLWLDKSTVAPSKPLIINIGSPAFRYRQVEVTTPEYTNVPTILVSAENRGDYVAIEVKPAHPQPIATPALSDMGEDNKSVEYNSEEFIKLTEADSSMVDTEMDDVVSVQIVAQLSEIGISLVSHKLHQELFFLEISGVSFVGLCKDDHQRLELRISDIHIDDQVSKSNDAETTSTILVNRGKVAQDQQRHFLQIYIDRPFSSCKDLCLKKVFVALDDVEVDITDALVDCIYDMYKECLKSVGSRSRQKVTLERIDTWVEKESLQALGSLDTTSILPPRSLVLDYLYIERFNLVLWCSFELDKLHMLGDLMRMGLRILCVSRHFELLGAPLQFQQEYFCNSCGTISSFYEQLKDKYLHAALGCIGSLLGYSSLLNIPKLPITVGRNTIEFAADAVDSVSSGLGSLLYMFTFDNDYINKRQRDRLSKPCSNMKEGIVNAGKSIGEGFMSLTNIVTKPIEGAQKEGMGGFIKGLGKGIAGSIVKPIDKVGQAVSHLSRGIKSNMSKPLLYERWAVEPCRKPRMLWGEFSQVKPYDLNDAEIKHLLGEKLIRNIKHCETVAKKATSHLVILFYPSKVYFVDLAKPRPSPIWKVHVSAIEETRASNLGIIIKSKDQHFQIPCTNANLIHSIFTSVENARKEACSTIILGPELFSPESY